VQQYLWLSVDRYGVEWMTFPSVHDHRRLIA
jgi:hypothetical protein